MINGKNVFDQPAKNDKVTYENIRKICTGSGDDYTTGSLLDYPYFKDSYKISFTANLDRARNTRIYFVLEKVKETILNFVQGTAKVM